MHSVDPRLQNSGLHLRNMRKDGRKWRRRFAALLVLLVLMMGGAIWVGYGMFLSPAQQSVPPTAQNDSRRDPMILVQADGPVGDRRTLTIDDTIIPGRVEGGTSLEAISIPLGGGHSVDLRMPSRSFELVAIESLRNNAADIGANTSHATMAATRLPVVAVSARPLMLEERLARIAPGARLTSTLTDTGVTLPEARAAAAQIAQGADPSIGGMLITRRAVLEGVLRLVHLQFIDMAGTAVTLGRTADAGFAPSANPWPRIDLRIAQRDGALVPQPAEVPSLGDALYDAFVRSGLDVTLSGQLLAAMNRVHDLDRALPDARRVVLLSARPGHVRELADLLYVGVVAGDALLECVIVTPPQGSVGEECDRGVRDLVIGRGLRLPSHGAISSRFGARYDPSKDSGLGIHRGVDWAAPQGAPVVAALGGTISRAGWSESYGNVIYIAHPDRVETRYAHLHQIADGIAVGDTVAAGQLIGTVGNTGYSRGAHLHFELRIAHRAVDPLLDHPPGDSALRGLEAWLYAAQPDWGLRAAGWDVLLAQHRSDLAARLSSAGMIAARADRTLQRQLGMIHARALAASLGGTPTAVDLLIAHVQNLDPAPAGLPANLRDWAIAEMAVVRQRLAQEDALRHTGTQISQNAAANQRAATLALLRANDLLPLTTP